MSYVPNPGQFNRLVKQLKSIQFFEWATRPFSFHFWEIDLNGYDNFYKHFIGKKFKYLILLSKGSYEIQYRNKQQHEQFINSLQGRLSNFDFLVKHEKKMDQLYKQMWELAKKLGKFDWNQFSNKQLAQFYNEYHWLYQKFIGAVSTGILISEAMAKNLKSKLEKSANVYSLKDNLDLAVRTISTPEKLSMTALEELEFLKLALDAKFSEKKLDRHCRKWSYIPVYAAYPEWTLEDYKLRLKQLNRKTAKTKLYELINHKSLLMKQKKLIYTKFNLLKQDQEMANLLSKYIYWRINDETTIGLMTHSRKIFFDAIGKRLFISPKQLSFMTREETVSALKTGKVDLALANERMKGFAQIINPDGVAVISGKDFKQLSKQVKLSSAAGSKQKASVLIGTPANPGLVKGRVRIVLEPSLIKKIKRGDILVTTNTTPAYVVAMKISGAILTEEGGITSHAAIVSRELGVPCIIGIPSVTKILKDGDMVEVDASKGIVRKLK